MSVVMQKIIEIHPAKYFQRIGTGNMVNACYGNMNRMKKKPYRDCQDIKHFSSASGFNLSAKIRQ